MTSPFSEYASTYIDENLRVFPLKPRDKMPAIPKSKGGNGCLDATTDPVQIGKWADDMPGANIGLATGNGLWVLDVDGDEGLHTVKELIAKHGPLPETSKQKTPNGWHIFFKENGVMIRNRSRNIGPGLDVRSAGGYVVVAPSIHPDGGIYEWIVAPWEIEIPEAPDWLTQLASTTSREREYQKQSQDRQERPRQRGIGNCGAYVEAALDSACAAISGAVEGEQEETLNRESYSIGTLVGSGDVSFEIARSALVNAGLAMPSYNGRRPWVVAEIEKKIDRSLRDGLLRPRDIPEREDFTTESTRARYQTPPQSEDGWPAPDMTILSERSDPPKWLSAPFDTFWSGFILAQADQTSAPPDYVANTLLVSAAALIGNARWVSPWGQWQQPPVLRIVNVGDPSSGKTPAEGTVIQLVRTIETEMAKDHPDTLRRYEAKKLEAKLEREKWEDQVKIAVDKGIEPPDQPAKAVEPDKPPLPRVMVNDITPEALGELHASNPKGLLYYRPELAAWVEGMDRYNAGGEANLWLEGFDGVSHTIDRKSNKNGPIVVPYLSLSVIGGLQPDRLSSLLFSGDDNGQAARFLYSWPNTVPRKRPTKAVDVETAQHAFRRLAALRMDEDQDGNLVQRIIRLSPEAADLFTSWWTNEAIVNETQAGGMFKSHLGKLPGILLRLSLVLEYLWWSVTNDPEPVQVGKAAIASAAHLIEDYYRPMAVRAFGEAALADEDRHAATIARRIVAKHLDRINAREIRRNWKLPGLRKQEPVKAALRVLEEANWIWPAGISTGGRPSSDYAVNPLVVGKP